MTLNSSRPSTALFFFLALMASIGLPSEVSSLQGNFIESSASSSGTNRPPIDEILIYSPAIELMLNDYSLLNIELADAGEIKEQIFLSKPLPDQTLEYFINRSATLVFLDRAFEFDTAEYIIEDHNLIVKFEDGGNLVFLELFHPTAPDLAIIMRGMSPLSVNELRSLISTVPVAESEEIADSDDLQPYDGTDDSETRFIDIDDGRLIVVSYLAPGETRVIDIRGGDHINLSHRMFDPSVATYQLSGNQLIVTLPNDATLVLEDFFFPHEEQPLLSILDGPPTTAEMLLATAAMPESVPAGPPAFGGGEMFQVLPTFQWLLSQIKFSTPSEAASVSDATLVDESQILAQILAQIDIATAFAKIAQFEGVVTQFLRIKKQTKDLESSGRGDIGDVRHAEFFLLDSQHSLEENQFEATLLLDHYQDAFGERLSIVNLPEWEFDRGRSLGEIIDGVPEQHLSEGRRQWRRALYSARSIQMLTRIEETARRVRDIFAQQYEVGARDVSAVLSAESTLNLVRIKLHERRGDLKAAEAWLMAARGELDAQYIAKPGWQ